MRSAEQGHHQAEKDDGGAVVEQAFALDEEIEPGWRTEAFEQGRYRNGVGGRHGSAEQQGQRPVKYEYLGRTVGQQLHALADVDQQQGGGDDGQNHTGDGQTEHRGAVTPQVVEADVKGGLEDEPGEEDQKQHITGQLGRLHELQRAQGQAGQHQGHGVGDAEAPRCHRHR